jgi:hypothetical protein
MERRGGVSWSAPYSTSSKKALGPVKPEPGEAVRLRGSGRNSWSGGSSRRMVS